MNSVDILRNLVIEQLRNVTDPSLLDLVYKLLVIEGQDQMFNAGEILL